MLNKIGKIIFSAICLISTASSLNAAQDKLNIVTTTTFGADLVRNIGGDHVEVKSVASPKFNIHFIQPKPSDVKNVARADLYVNVGLDLEAWSDPLLEAAGKPDLFRGGSRNVDLSQSIRLLNAPQGELSRAMGDLHLFGNPHYIMSPENAKIMTATILEALKQADPVNAAYYEENRRSFVTRLDAKIAEWKGFCLHCAGQEIISYHDDIVYFADFMGLKVNQYLEPKPGIPPTPKHLEFLQEYIRRQHVKAIVMPTYFPKDAVEALSKKVGVKVVTICQNAGELPGTENVIGFFDYNVRQISEALR